MIALFTIVALSYLLGSIPTSVWTARAVKGIDIRDYGSGNAGATNTFRILGWKPGTFVLLFDFLKGFTAAYFISQLAGSLGGLPDFLTGDPLLIKIVASISAVIGHMFPVFAGFKGGKGVITAAGTFYGIEPISVSLSVLTFIVVLLPSRYVSLSSMCAAAGYVLFVFLLEPVFGQPSYLSHQIFAIFIASAVIIKHKTNIKRLMNGNENRISSFKPAKGRLNKEEEQ